MRLNKKSVLAGGNVKMICLGDSGGPLACREADGNWYLRGLVSFVYAKPKCFKCRSVASFTKVAAFQDWIIEKIACEVA